MIRAGKKELSIDTEVDGPLKGRGNMVRTWDDRHWFKRMVQNEVKQVAQDH